MSSRQPPVPTRTPLRATAPNQPAAVNTQPAVVTTQEAAANAGGNQPNLAAVDNVLDTEVLVVADGSITTLAEAATGDRPLLVWFWAPH